MMHTMIKFNMQWTDTKCFSSPQSCEENAVVSISMKSEIYITIYQEKEHDKLPQAQYILFSTRNDHIETCWNSGRDKRSHYSQSFKVHKKLTLVEMKQKEDFHLTNFFHDKPFATCHEHLYILIDSQDHSIICYSFKSLYDQIMF